MSSEPSPSERLPAPAVRHRFPTAGEWEENPYGRTFWLIYASNLLMMMAVTLLYRYADFVILLGGSEYTAGQIVGCGMVGSLLMRFTQGAAIDRYGSRLIWCWSLVGFALSIAAHVLVERIDSPTIYLLRVALSTSVAGAYGASITCVSRQLPIARMAEVIGTLGTSGFVAMAIGPVLGDWLRGTGAMERHSLDSLFWTAAGLAACSALAAAGATRGETPPAPRRRLPLFWLLRRYHPGPVLIMGFVMGAGFALPTIFLTTFAQAIGINRIAGFFGVYAATAFVTRVATRRFPYRFGVRPMILIGVTMMALSVISYLGVSQTWHLTVPGFFAGMAHALLFPSVMASGSVSFPKRHRGLGNTVMLAMMDLGTLIGAPVMGGLVDLSQLAGLPPYPTTFVVTAGSLAAWGAIFAWQTRRPNGAS